jgi:septum formation protein
MASVPAMMVHFPHIHLASRSPRRREILAQIGVRFEVLLPEHETERVLEVDETPRPGENPVDYVLRLAREKVAAGWTLLRLRGLPNAPVLAADTTVCLDDRIIGKPADGAEAEAILSCLTGRTHQVHTGVAVALGDRIEACVSTTAVTFGALGPEQIRRYVGTGDPLDKAGAYGIQGPAGVFVSAIAGSHSGVMGLPVYETAKLLGRFGVLLP